MGAAGSGRLICAARHVWRGGRLDRKSTRLNSSHRCISYAVFCLKKKKVCYVELSFGGDADEAVSADMTAPALDLGINVLDTVDPHITGHSEHIRGKLPHGARDEL